METINPYPLVEIPKYSYIKISVLMANNSYRVVLGRLDYLLKMC